MANGSMTRGQFSPAQQRAPMPDLEPDAQTVIVLQDASGPSETIVAMCAALEIEIVHVSALYDLPFRLHHHQPVAVIATMDLCERTSCAALRAVAGYNPDLPVMLVAPNDPASQGTIDAAEQIWNLSAITRLTGGPGPRDLIGFLFQAGRWSNTGQLIPLF